MRTVFAFLLRLVLFMPLAALAYLCDALHQFFERLSEGLFDMARATRQMTKAPYVREWERLIEAAHEERRLALLERLRDGVK